MPNAQTMSEFRQLCDAVFDGRATQQHIEQLQNLVLSSPDLKRLYAELVHQHASLSWSVIEFDPEGVRSIERFDTPRQSVAVPTSNWHRNYWLSGIIATAAIIMTVLFSPYFLGQRHSKNESVASLVHTKNGLWRATELPTANGSRLVPGQMILVEGLATIRFDHGVNVDVEAPANFEIVSPHQIHLNSGRLVATTKPGNTGFTVRTPTAEFIDQGQEFGVSVGDAGVSDVVVFDGPIEATPIATGDSQILKTGKRIRISTTDVTSIDEGDDQMASLVQPTATVQNGIIQISTATGRGQDAYVQRVPRDDAFHSSATLLLVKNSVSQRTNENQNRMNWDRKAYLRFDLVKLDSTQIEVAELVVHFAPTGFGFASLVPDATFAVYVVTDENLDHWSEQELNWENAPGNHQNGAKIHPNIAELVGQFVVPQGQPSGAFSVRGDALCEHINSDSNGLLTLVIVRETASSKSGGLVHGFASHRHPELPPPTLRLKTKVASE